MSTAIFSLSLWVNRELSANCHRTCKRKEKEIIGRSDEPLTILRFKYGFPTPALNYDPDYVTENPDDVAKMGEVNGRAAAKRHGERARKKKEERFDLFGIEEIIPIVSDEHFEYEMSEAIAAYKHKLFLAANAVTGVALENILVLIKKRKNSSRQRQNLI